MYVVQGEHHVQYSVFNSLGHIADISVMVSPSTYGIYMYMYIRGLI